MRIHGKLALLPDSPDYDQMKSVEYDNHSKFSQSHQKHVSLKLARQFAFAKSKKEQPEITTLPKKSLEGLGFTTADQMQKPEGLFTLPGPIGKLLGDLQQFKLQMVLAGETHSSKSELAKQLADAFVQAGFKTAYIDWEHGGITSKDTQDGLNRNVSPENLKKLYISGDIERTLEDIKALSQHFQVIILDSGTKLNEVTNAWIDTLRNEYPQTIWIIVMQQNTRGGTRGGTAAEFDSPIVIYTYRPDEKNQLKNYAVVFKNRGNNTGFYYNIAKKELINKIPGS